MLITKNDTFIHCFSFPQLLLRRNALLFGNGRAAENKQTFTHR